MSSILHRCPLSSTGAGDWLKNLAVVVVTELWHINMFVRCYASVKIHSAQPADQTAVFVPTARLH